MTSSLFCVERVSLPAWQYGWILLPFGLFIQILCRSYALVDCKYIKMADFMDAYKAIFFIAITSLVLFCTPALLDLFLFNTEVETSKWNFDYYLIYAAYHDPIYKIHQRNIGVFWEPGMYQGYLILVVLYVATAKKRNIRTLLYQLIMVTTLFTTQSSTGFILLLLALLVYILTGLPPKSASLVAYDGSHCGGWS